MGRAAPLIAQAQEEERAGRWCQARALFEQAIRASTPDSATPVTDPMRWVGRFSSP